MMNVTKYAFICAFILSLLMVELARAVDFLPGMKNFHVIWVGSPLRDEQYSKLRELCDQLRAAKVNSKSGVEIEKLILWYDAKLLKDKNLSLFGIEDKRKDELNPSCKGLLEARDISELFKEDHCKKENLPQPLGEIQNLNVVQGLSVIESELNRLSQSADRCPTVLGKSQEFSSLPSDCNEDEKRELNRHYSQIKIAYEFLRSRMKELGATAFAPMADLLRIIAIQRMGGIYMDINKDFTQLGFEWDPASTSRITNCDSVVVAHELSCFIVPEKVAMPPNFAAPILGSTPWAGGLTAQFFKENLHKPSLPGCYRLPRPFTNNDFFAASCPNSKPITKLLAEVSLGYQTLMKNPSLSVFMNSDLFSSMPWVWSLAGPTRLTSVLAKADSKDVIRTHQLSIYQGATSWLKFPSKPWGSIFLSQCFKQSKDNGLHEIYETCFEKNTFDTIQDIRSNNDIDSCFFDRILESIENGRIRGESLNLINSWGARLPEKVKAFEQAMKEKCAQRISMLGDRSKDPIDASPDLNKKVIMCHQDTQEKIDRLNESLKYPNAYDLAIRTSPSPSPPPPIQPVVTKAKFNLSDLDYAKLCAP